MRISHAVAELWSLRNKCNQAIQRRGRPVCLPRSGGSTKPGQTRRSAPTLVALFIQRPSIRYYLAIFGGKTMKVRRRNATRRRRGETAPAPPPILPPPDLTTEIEQSVEARDRLE